MKSRGGGGGVANKNGSVTGREVHSTPTMNTLISKKLVSGVRGLVPYSVRMKKIGMVRVPNAKPFTTGWVPAKVVSVKKDDRMAKRKAHLEHYGEVQAKLKAHFWSPEMLRVCESDWADLMYGRESLLRPLPEGRMKPAEFRAWIAEGASKCRDATDRYIYGKHALKLRMKYYAELPECVFAPAVRQERDAAVLRAYRDSYTETMRVKQIRTEIRHLQILLQDYQEWSRYFDSKEEADAEIAEVSARLVTLFDQIKNQ